MKHRGPASSLQPAREASRARERSWNVSTAAPAAVTVTQAPMTAMVGDWTVTSDNGQLIAIDPDGTRHTLATRTEGDA